MYNITTDMVPEHEKSFRIIEDSMDRGIKIDIEKIKSIYDDALRECKDTLAELGCMYEIDNADSNVQIKRAFLKILKDDDMHYCMVKGKISFNKEVLQKLADVGYELADIVLKYRKEHKMMEQLNTLYKSSDNNGYIHPFVDRGATNRINYSKPALMNIPKSILWDVIIPYNKNNSLYSVDIHQQEPWIIVNMLGIEELKNLISEHKDFYSALFYKAVGRECTDIERKEVKRAWNAMSYGAYEATVKTYCPKFGGILYKYFNSIAEYKKFKSDAYSMAKRNVHKVKTLFGTELFADEQGNKLQRVLMNIPIQGTGSDILTFLINHFNTEVKKGVYKGKMSIYYTRHDELIIEVSGDISEQDAKMHLKDVFEHRINDWEPFQLNICKVSENKISDMNEDD